MTIALVSLGLMLVPFLVIGVLGIIGLVRPDIREKAFRQLRQPFAMRQPPIGRNQMRDLEDEAIRRYGQNDEPK